MQSPIHRHLPNELYELVFHSDGTLARDWGRREPLSLPIPTFHMSECLDSMAEIKRPLVLVAEECVFIGGRCRPVSGVSTEMLLRCDVAPLAQAERPQWDVEGHAAKALYAALKGGDRVKWKSISGEEKTGEITSKTSGFVVIKTATGSAMVGKDINL
jgi:hypothetical protein